METLKFQLFVGDYQGGRLSLLERLLMFSDLGNQLTKAVYMLKLGVMSRGRFLADDYFTSACRKLLFGKAAISSSSSISLIL